MITCTTGRPPCLDHARLDMYRREERLPFDMFASMAGTLGLFDPAQDMDTNLAGFIVHDGDLFADWKGDGFIGGLSSMSLVRIEFEGENAREAQRFDMQRRIREVEQGPDGALWLLEDGTREGEGWLLELTPR